ncbi:MAG TPA: c-type cytochrome [Vicinamibacteria bacterium]|nr:c-type cytochrome [Vicinamibacteria bacterium]
MNPKTRKALWWVLGATLLAVILVTGPKGPRELDTLAGFLPGNPHRGGELFYERGCVGCHAISGIGGKEAADLARPGGVPSDLEDIAGAMWNHAPEMWESMRSAGLTPPQLSPEDVADLMAFLFAAGYLEEQGDPGRGRAVLTSKKCRNCHPLGDESSGVGPNLARWSSRANPIVWSAALWNHAPEMEKAMKAEGIAWPELSKTEVNDILAYLRTTGSVPHERAPLPGDPRTGQSLFRRDCQGCHKAEGEGGDVGPNLDEGAEAPSLAGLAASFWNHSPAMGERMSQLGVERPMLSESEMADLITYLFAIRYFERRGDVTVGARIYEARCGKCHGEEGRGNGKDGPELHPHKRQMSAVFLASALWNHGPRMYEQATDRGLNWPKFANHEMHDLIAYLRSLSP